MQIELKEMLEDLSPFVKKTIHLIRSNLHVLIPENLDYIERKPTNFTYDFSGPKATWINENVTLPFWKNAGREYRRLINEHNFDQELYHKYPNIDSLCHYVFLLFIENKLSNKSINNAIKTYWNHINNQEITNFHWGFIEGLAINEKGIRFRYNDLLVHIRQVLPSDISGITEATYSSAYAMEEYQWRTRATSIIEIKGNSVDFIKYRELNEKLYISLFLFTACSMQLYRQSSKTNSIVHQGFWGSISSFHYNYNHPKLNGYLKGGENKLFQHFFNKIDTSSLSKKDKEIKPTPLSIAYDQLKDALMHQGHIFKKIALVTIGIEALILDDKSEIKTKFSLRTAKLFHNIYGLNIAIKDFAGLAYDLRSNYVHGSTELEKKQKSKIESFGGELTFYASLTQLLKTLIIVNLLLGMKKNDLIQLLDAALLSETKDEELKNLLKPHMGIINRHVNIVINKELVSVPRFV